MRMGYFFTDPTDATLIDYLLYYDQDRAELAVTLVSRIIYVKRRRG